MDMRIIDQTNAKHSQSSSVYLQDFRSEPCQVCGENASGWHCGSITWSVGTFSLLNYEFNLHFLVKHAKNFSFDQLTMNIVNTNV